MKIASTLTMMILCASPLLSQSTLYEWAGAASNDNFGRSVSAAGDLDGDGHADVIVGAHLADPNGISYAGSAYAYSGETGLLLYQWDGPPTGKYFGKSVSAAGDVNNDGHDDVIVGAELTSPNGIQNAGSVYVYSGADGSLLHQFDGSSTDAFFGRSVAAAGDVNNDGWADLIIGAPYGGIGNSGSAYVYSGFNGSLLHDWSNNSAHDLFGHSVSSAGDVNSDGYDDVLVGTFGADPNGLNSAGSAYIYSGQDGSTLYQLDGTSAGDYFGYSVSTVGDANGDGTDDVVIGAKYYDANGLTDCGAAFLYSGASGNLLYTFYGEFDSLHFGTSVSGAGDIDGDGLKDVIIGTDGLDAFSIPFAGAAYLYSGATGMLLHKFEEENLYDSFGYSVSGAGDVNADGFDDVVVGAFQADPNNQNQSGAAYVFSYHSRPDYTISNLSIGQQAVFNISDAPPLSQIHIGLSLTGPGPTATSFGIVDMSLPINLLFSGTAGPLGNASFTRLVPLGIGGITLYTQAKAGSILSNALAVIVQ